MIECCQLNVAIYWQLRQLRMYTKSQDYNYNQIALYLIMMSQTALLSRTLKSYFSTIPSHLKDWEYISKIEQNLKHNNIGEAAKYLINSSLNRKVLDVHIFRSFYMKVHELSYGLSYEEIAYKIYRESFKPQILILDWMNSLARSSNERIINMLQQDYKYLKIEMPKVEKATQQQQNAQILQHFSNKPLNEQMNNNREAKALSANPNVTSVQLNVGKEQTNLQKYQINKLLEVVPTNEQNAKKIIKEFTTANAKIIIHNVQYIYEDLNGVEGDTNQEYEGEHQVQEGQDEIQEVEVMEVLKKIKIEKIQILTNNKLNQNTFDTDTDKSPKK